MVSPDKALATSSYLFCSARLGFRPWQIGDLEALHALNSDPEVMVHFPSLPSRSESQAFIHRMHQLYVRRGFCYFAVERLEDRKFIGFIGLAEQTFAAPFTPCIDLGWRLKRSAWQKGYATEGARTCLQWAFEYLKVPRVYAMAPVVNRRSLAVMQRLGMQPQGHFLHPNLVNYPHLQPCALYVQQNPLTPHPLNLF